METNIGVSGLILIKITKNSVLKVRATIFYLFLIIFFVAINPAHSVAADFYVAQSAAGNASGSSCANARIATWFNTSSNWANPKVAGKVGPGDTVHLCGTISTALEIQESGSSGAVITILFEPGAKMSSPAWSANGAIKAYAKNYITIDGGAIGIIGGPNGNPALANGIIECTANGTGLANHVDARGVLGVTANHFTVKNLVVRNIYVRTSGTEQLSYGIGISDTASNGPIVGYAVYNNIVYDANVGINSDFNNGCANYEISYNTAYNCNWGAVTGSRGNASDSLSNLLVHDNYFHSWTNWNDPSTNAFHHNGYFAFADYGSITSPKVYNNVFGPGFGGSYQTSGIYINTGIYTPLVYNNVFIVGTNEYCGNGFITVDSVFNTTLNIYNNTFISAGGTSGTAIQLNGKAQTQTINVKNNLTKGAFTAIALFNKDNVTLNSDYNSYYGLNESLAFVYSSTSSGVFKTLAQWVALGFDAHRITDDPKVKSSTDGHLQPVSPNRDSGVALSSYFTTDKDGLLRPTDAQWDIGAYEYLSVVVPQNFGITR